MTKQIHKVYRSILISYDIYKPVWEFSEPIVDVSAK